jgi:hypothetical protein
METYLIFRQLTNDEAVSLKANAGTEKNNIIYLAGTINQNEYKNITTSTIPSDLIKQSEQVLLQKLLAFGDLKVVHQTVGELFNQFGMPLWHYQRFRIFFNLKEVFLIRQAIQYYSVSSNKVTVYTSHVSGLFSDYADVAEVKSLSKSNVKKSLNLKSIINYSIFFVVRNFISILLPADLKSARHAVVDRSIKQYCRHIHTLKPKLDNYNLSTLFDITGDDFFIISEVEPPKLKGKETFRLLKEHFSGMGRRKRTINSEYILLKGAFSLNNYRHYQIRKKELKRDFSLLKNTFFDEENKLICDAFINLESSALFYIFKNQVYKSFFSKLRVQTISAIDENSPATRCIMDAARTHGSRSIGIQHGNIGTSQPAYLYTETDRKNHIMADATLVWGEYWKKLLFEKSSFDKDSLIVTGQMRTDIIPKLLLQSSVFKAKFTSKKKLVVFASQPIPDQSLRWQAAFDVFQAFANQKDTGLIVKLHPAERDAVAYYSEIAHEAGVLNPEILFNVDLYEILSACDLLITCYSTVGGEGVYFGKPLIILDHHKTDLLGYYSEGIAWQATDAESLRILSEKILSGELLPDQSKRNSFISNYVFSIDGKATQRCLEAINSQ